MFQLFPSRTIALDLFDFPIHWYGIMYLLSFLLAFFLIPRLQRYRNLHLTQDDWSRIIGWAIVGVLVGGRLGFVFFYEPVYYLVHPLEIFAVWNGGMASHGGFIGVAIALLVVLRYRSWKEILGIADVISIPVVLGLGIGRIGNFINGELYGIVTTLSWGVYFPGVEGLRHPVQLYEFGVCLAIALICYWHLIKTSLPGRTFGFFLTLYGIERILIEFFRIHEHPPIVFGLVREQLLTVPLLAVGLSILYLRRKRTTA